MVYYETKNQNWGSFWRVLQMGDVGIFYGHLVYLKLFGIFDSNLVYLMGIWYILQPLGLFYSHLIYFMAIWYSFPFWKNLATLLHNKYVEGFKTIS
jgi:hypothetical protein